MSRKRRSIRQNLLQGISSAGRNGFGGFTDEENADNLAKRMFDYYNKDQSPAIDTYEIGSMLKDAYAAIGVNFQPTEEDIAQYSKSIDYNGDGKVTLDDFEKMMHKFLV